MHLNGWHRLWIVASVVWGIVVLALVGSWLVSSKEIPPGAFRGPREIISAWLGLSSVVWVITSAAMYALGWVVAWIRQGFARNPTAPNTGTALPPLSVDRRLAGVLAVVALIAGAGLVVLFVAAWMLGEVLVPSGSLR